MDFLHCSRHLLSASTGTLSGRVTTSAGAPVADVQVSLPDLHRSTTTDSSGRYSIPGLRPGPSPSRSSALAMPPPSSRVSTGSDLTADVTMRESVVELTGIQVTASANATERTQLSAAHQRAGGEEHANHTSAQSRRDSAGESPASTAGAPVQALGKPVIAGFRQTASWWLDDGQRIETHSGVTNTVRTSRRPQQSGSR